MSRDCIHGQLARSCNICELEAQVKEDEALLRQALGALTDPYTWDTEAAIAALRERLGDTK